MSDYKLSHLQELEAESIHIIREVAAEFENPVMLYSIGKDSSVMVRLAEKAFSPGKVPFPLMHIDSKWKFKEMIQFRDDYAKKFGWNLIVESNMEAFEAGVGPFTHGSKVHTDLMKTQALLHALDKYKFDAAFGGARRDEEKSRAKERIYSFRDKFHQWDPKNQRPELWDIYNARVHKGESIRVFPLSNWTELDIWQYIRLENIPIVPLYFAKERKLDWNILVAEEFMRSVVSTVSDKAAEAGIAMTLEADGDPGTFEADASALSAALVNLLENAVDACRADGSKKEHYVRVSVKGLPDAVEVRIEDNGIGMTEETRTKLFTLFFSSKGKGGTGIGLYVARQVVMQHGGRIEVASVKGEGSTFTVTMPRILAK